ncbi:unnamed protein product [Chrysoparadoxa australica]
MEQRMKTAPKSAQRNKFRMPARSFLLLGLLPCVLGFIALPQGVHFYDSLPVSETSAAKHTHLSATTASRGDTVVQTTTPSDLLTSYEALQEEGKDLPEPLAAALDNAKKLSKGADFGDLQFVPAADDASRRATILARAYSECQRITSIFAKTFYLGTKFMPLEAKQAVWAIYVWCRRTDDIVDGPRAIVRGKASMQADLDDWQNRLEDIWEGQPKDALDLALMDAKMRYPTMSIRPYIDMIGGMILDVPGSGKNRYATWEELEEYCYRVAGTVGLMTLPILGTAPGVTEAEAKEPALALGIALQLTNILRDVGEDAVRGRIYLPVEDLNRFGISEDNIINGVLDENYRRMMRFQIARTRYYYAKAREGIPMLAPASRLPVQASLDMYGKILQSLEQNGYDNFRNRAYVSKTDKLLTLPLSWLRTLTPATDGPEVTAKAAKLVMELAANPADDVFRLTRYDLLLEEEAKAAAATEAAA